MEKEKTQEKPSSILECVGWTGCRSNNTKPENRKQSKKMLKYDELLEAGTSHNENSNNSEELSYIKLAFQKLCSLNWVESYDLL